MDITRLDELMLAIMDSPRQERLTALKEFVSAIGKPVPEEVADRLETLWEEWTNWSINKS